MSTPNPNAQRFTPNFASLGLALRLIVLAELIALIITIGRNSGLNAQAWQEFNLLSAFALAIAFVSALVLRVVAPLLKRVSVTIGSTLVVLLLLLVTAVGTDALVFALYDLGLIPERWPEWRGSFLVRSLLIAFIVAVFGLRYLILQQRAETEARSQQEARMQALQSRIRPHFLFNSLNSVASLTRSDPTKAEMVLHDLADLFRVLLADARKLVPISAEREISRQYLEIEKIRLGDRLQIKWNVGNLPRSAQIPALTLQPLLENAIYHGIEPRFAGGQIKIDMWAESDILNVLISNPLPDVKKQSHSKGNKIAQDNIRQRLATQFGERASMQSFEEAGQYHVKVKMPIVLG
ncbi:MAG: histidine kinase [Pseudomonadota bacterium]|nr:MAG: histidine kinase [Pseudomonadota bacterium]